MPYDLPVDQQPALEEIRARLLATFGPQRDGARLDPLSVLVLAVVRSRTADELASAAFARLRRRFPAWELLADADPAEVERLIAPVTDHEIKARFLTRAMLKVVKWSSLPSLDFLEDWDEEPAMQWLRSLPGIGVGIAAAVLNFSTLRKRVMAVDAPFLRVASRLRLVSATADFEGAYEDLMRLVPDAWNADDLYEFHWLLAHLAHSACGREQPSCALCPLGETCRTGTPKAAPMRESRELAAAF